MPRCRAGKLSGYGELTASACARWHQPVDESTDDIAPQRNGDAGVARARTHRGKLNALGVPAARGGPLVVDPAAAGAASTVMTRGAAAQRLAAVGTFSSESYRPTCDRVERDCRRYPRAVLL